MENQEKQLDEKENLKLIEKTIQTAKKNTMNYPFLYLPFGWSVFIYFLGIYIFMVLKIHNPIAIMTYPIILFSILGLYSVYKKSDENAIFIDILWSFWFKQDIKNVKTYTDEFIMHLWRTLIISIFIIQIMSSRLWLDTGLAITKNTIHLLPFTIIIYGIGVIVSGKVLQFNALTVGGFIALIFGTYCGFVDMKYQFLLVAATALFGIIIPGYISRKKLKHEGV